MDEYVDRKLAPTRRIGDLPDHTWKYLLSMTPEDISRQRRWGAFILWAETTGRYCKWIVGSAVVLFGASVFFKGAIEGWVWLIKWWRA